MQSTVTSLDAPKSLVGHRSSLSELFGSHPWLPMLIVFISNTCMMILELVAGRIIAPYVGVSLYTWTSVIGVVLAGMSLGNYLGGRIADRWASARLLGIRPAAGRDLLAGRVVQRGHPGGEHAGAESTR